MNELDLFAAAIAATDPAERAALLERECAGRPEVRQRLDQLISAHFRTNPLLDVPDAEPTTDLGSLTSTASLRLAEEAEGTVVAGRYKLLQRIGEGGMGTVWMADQTEPVKRRVAVKLIRAHQGNSRTILSRFEAERQAIALMDHPNIAKLLDAGTTAEGSPYFVMELVKGIPLNEFCDEHRLAMRDRLNLFMQICSAVQHAHQKGIIHRDLKPTNILVESHDGKPVPKVIDFGLAKATSAMQLTDHTLFTAFGSVLGTPLYMAPEQANFNAVDVDTRADVYALGVILYELLTGTTPITRESMKKAAFDEMLRLIREQDAPTPSSRLSTVESAPSIAANRQMEPQKLGRFVKGELDWIVMKALSKERDRRYETATGFARDVERFLNNEAVSAGPPSASYRLRKFVRRNRGRVVAAGLVLFALLVGIAGTTFGLIRAEQKRREAERNLAYARKGNEILGSVFRDLDPRRNFASDGELRDALKANLGRATRELEGSAIGDPLIVAEMQGTLGLSLLGLGDANRARILLEKATETATRELGLDHPETLQRMNNLGGAYHEAGKLDLALPLWEETLRLRKSRLGLDHPDTLKSMNNLALAYEDAGKLDLMLPLLEETLRLQKSRLGLDHPDTLKSISNLALTYREAGKFGLALPMLQETLKVQESRLGLNHPDTVLTMHNLASTYRIAGKPDLALPLHEEAIQRHKARFGPDHPRTLILMSSLGWTLLTKKSFVEAEPLLRDCLARSEATQPDNWRTFYVRSLLGEALLGQKKYAEAEPLLREGYEGMKRREKTIPGPSLARLPEALDRLIEFSSATNRPDELKKWQAERARYGDVKPTETK